MIWWGLGVLLLMTGCSWGPPEIKPHGVKALILNFIADEVEKLQTRQEKRGRIPKVKEPLVSWGPFQFRSDGRAKYRPPVPRKERRLLVGPDDRVSTSASAKLSLRQVYFQLKVRF